MFTLAADIRTVFMVGGLVATGAISLWRLEELTRSRRVDRKHIESLRLWRQRVNTTLRMHHIHVPEDEEDSD